MPGDDPVRTALTPVPRDTDVAPMDLPAAHCFSDLIGESPPMNDIPLLLDLPTTVVVCFLQLLVVMLW